MKEKVNNLIRSTDFWFVLILIIGIFARFYKIDFQSLWNDELATYTWLSGRFNSIFKVIESCKADVHPPFYFLIANFWLKYVNYSEMSLRVLSAIFGSLGIVSIYYYGKKVFNPFTGLCASTLTSLNYFHILHSQNARPYSLLFLLTVLSYFTFSLFIEKLDMKTLMIYVLSTTALIYTHYFGLFVLIAQGFYVVFLIVAESENRKKLFKYYFFSGISITFLYFPWIVHIFKNLNRKSWMAKPRLLFIVDYFVEYFGSQYLYKFIFLIFTVSLIIFILKIIENRFDYIKGNKNFNTSIMLLIWILITYLIPYLKSIFSYSLLTPRNTIVTLPALILLSAYLISFLKNVLVKNTIIVFFFSVSFTYMFFSSGYYTNIKREQWRNVVQTVSKENCKENLIASGRNTQYFQEYFNLLGSEIKVILLSKQTFINAFKNKSIKGIWILGAHFKDEKMPIDDLIENYFVKEKSYKFLNSKCELYKISEENRKILLLNDRINFIKEKFNKLGSSWIVQEGDWIGNWSRVGNTLQMNAVWKNPLTNEKIEDILEISNINENGQIEIYRKGLNNFYSGKIDYKNKIINGNTGWQTGWSAKIK